MIARRTLFVTIMSSPAPPVIEPLPLNQAWLVLVVVVIADVMDFIDSSIANVAGPSIRADLGGSDSTLQWVLSAYTATFALGLVTSGRLGDILGRRRLFLIGMLCFTLASLACGLAPNVPSLIIFRALQGLAGAVMIPQGFSLVKIAFPPEHLRRALVPFGPIMGAAGVGGPILAGWLLHLDLFGSQWRSIFFINVPIGVLAIVLAILFLPRHAAEDPTLRVDVSGVVLLTAACALLIVPLVQGRELGWPWWTYVMFAGAVTAFALFVRSERRSTHPVITPSLFGKRSFIVGLLVVAGFFASQTGFTLAFNLLLQLGFGWTALHTGLTLIPWALGTAVGTVLSGAVLAGKLGRRTLHLGLGLAAIGMLTLWWTIAAHSTDLTSFIVAPALLVGGLGAGMVFIPLFDYILGDATAEEVGTGSGLLNAVQQFASALGAAALGTVFFTRATGGQHAYVSAANLVIVIAAVTFAATFLLVNLLPKRIQQPEPNAEERNPAAIS
jgi:EmrB/QacA subfamily drug resistance transporter